MAAWRKNWFLSMKYLCGGKLKRTEEYQPSIARCGIIGNIGINEEAKQHGALLKRGGIAAINISW
jgi:hypothetical protein